MSNDISEFEIEGISIGDSLLDFYTLNEINNLSEPLKFGKKYFSKWKKIYKISNNKKYESIVFVFRADDRKFKIQNIEGRIYFKNVIGKCYNQQDLISKELEEIILNADKKGPTLQKLETYPNGSSYARYIDFIFSEGSYARLSCVDYSPEDTNSVDRLGLMIGTYEYSDWVHSYVLN